MLVLYMLRTIIGMEDVDWNDVTYSKLTEDSKFSAIASALNVQRVLEDKNTSPGSDQYGQSYYLSEEVNSNFEILEVSQSDVFSNWKAIKEIIFPQTLKLSVLPVADVSNTLTNSYFGHQIKLSDSKDTSFFVTISDDCNQCSSDDKFYKIDNQVSHKL